MAVHIYFGDGKGKTTAATGLAARCAGYGKSVAVYRFLKCDNSGECLALSEDIDFYCVDEHFGFVFDMSDGERNKIKSKTRMLFEKAKSEMRDLLVLDEILGAIEVGFVDEQEVLDFIGNADFEIVLTGRYASEKLICSADYVTEMKKIKHIYDKGIGARKGIEY